MEAGLPLLVISFLAGCVLLAWQFGGQGLRTRRAVIAGFVVAGLAVCWALLLSFGIFHPAGKSAAAVGFMLAISALFVPWLWRQLPRSISGVSNAAQPSLPADVPAAASRRQGRG